MSARRRRPPRHTIARALAMAATALLAAALLAANVAPATGWNQGSAEATLFRLMNGARVNNGLRAVQQNGTLVSLARWRSKDQVERDYFSHTIKGTSYLIYHWYDLNGLQYSWGGDNIGWNNGYSDADSAVAIHEGFMASPDHRRNILEPSFTQGGVGAYAKDNVMFLGSMRSPRFYTQLFMAAASSAPPPPPDDAPPPGGGEPTSPSSPAPKEDHRAKPLHVDDPVAPRASNPLDGRTLVAAGPRARRTAAEARRVAILNQQAGIAISTSAPVPGKLRVQSAAAPERGLFETLMGSLLGFLL